MQEGILYARRERVYEQLSGENRGYSCGHIAAGTRMRHDQCRIWCMLLRTYCILSEAPRVERSARFADRNKPEARIAQSGREGARRYTVVDVSAVAVAESAIGSGRDASHTACTCRFSRALLVRGRGARAVTADCGPHGRRAVGRVLFGPRLRCAVPLAAAHAMSHGSILDETRSDSVQLYPVTTV